MINVPIELVTGGLALLVALILLLLFMWYRLSDVQEQVLKYHMMLNEMSHNDYLYKVGLNNELQALHDRVEYLYSQRKIDKGVSPDDVSDK